MAILDHELGWSKKPVSTLDLHQDQDAPTEEAEIGKMVLTDLVAKPSDSERYLEVQGRVKNASDDSLKGLKIAVTLEGRAGNLLETDDAYLKPDPLEPGEVGTFKLLVNSAERYDLLKVDFTARSGKSVPGWTSRARTCISNSPTNTAWRHDVTARVKVLPMIARPLAILLLLASTAIADYPARVVGVSDGDTHTVLTAEKLDQAPGQCHLRARRPDLYGKLVEPPPPGQDPVTKPGWALAGKADGPGLP